MNITDPIPVSEAASITGLSPRRVRELAVDGSLRAAKFGRDWLISRKSAKAFVPVPVGRPKESGK
jgi:excisionase family DNA binding protein